MNRGSLARRLDPVSRVCDFNEAPIHESGKSDQTASCPGIASYFNEAPIHESGKSGRPSWMALKWLHFNEAPIHESGKCNRSDRCSGGERTSMRPRFMNRGSADGQTMDWHGASLQ